MNSYGSFLLVGVWSFWEGEMIQTAFCPSSLLTFLLWDGRWVGCTCIVLFYFFPFKFQFLLGERCLEGNLHFEGYSDWLLKSIINKQRCILGAIIFGASTLIGRWLVGFYASPFYCDRSYIINLLSLACRLSSYFHVGFASNSFLWR